MPARCHFNSGFPAHVRATEGQITNNEPILMGVNINPVRVLKYTQQWSQFKELMAFTNAFPADLLLFIMYGMVGNKSYVIFTLIGHLSTNRQNRRNMMEVLS